MPKKAIASKRPRESSSSEYDWSQFVSADAEARFHNSVTCHYGIKDRGFYINVENTRVEDF